MEPLYRKVCVIKDSGLWDVALCHWVGSSQYFEGNYCCILKGSASPWGVEQTMSHPGTFYASIIALRKPQNLQICMSWEKVFLDRL
jgi:hypothetical protein